MYPAGKLRKNLRVKKVLKSFFLQIPFISGTEVSMWNAITFPCPATSRIWIKQKPTLFQRPWELTWFHHCSKFPLGTQPDSQCFLFFFFFFLLLYSSNTPFSVVVTLNGLACPNKQLGSYHLCNIWQAKKCFCSLVSWVRSSTVKNRITCFVISCMQHEVVLWSSACFLFIFSLDSQILFVTFWSVQPGCILNVNEFVIVFLLSFR